MMRFSDLRKKRAPAPREAAETPAPRPPASPARPARPPDPPPERFRPSQEPACADAPQQVEVRCAEARRTYGRAVGLMRSVFSGPAPSFADLLAVGSELADLVASDHTALLSLAHFSTRDETLAAHSVNVAILALRLGAAVGRQDEKLLGMAALLHDLGRAPSYRLALEPGLGAEEAARIRRAVAASAAHAGDLGETPPEAGAGLARLISQMHGGPETAREAQIISLCDAYEALTHGDAAKPPLHPCIAFKALAALRPGPDHGLVKRLLEQISPFPPGSLLELADGRIGCVASINPKTLTRPLIEIWMLADGKAAEPAAFVDLGHEPFVAVAGVPDEKRLSNPVVTGRLAAIRAWMSS